MKWRWGGISCNHNYEKYRLIEKSAGATDIFYVTLHNVIANHDVTSTLFLLIDIARCNN